MDRRTWAYQTTRLLTAGITPVRYGSADFFSYPGTQADALRARTAAMLVAAECWARDSETWPERAADEIRIARTSYLDREAEWADLLIWPKIAERARAHALRGIARSERER